jgi:hypothetical protein
MQLWIIYNFKTLAVVKIKSLNARKYELTIEIIGTIWDEVWHKKVPIWRID